MRLVQRVHVLDGANHLAGVGVLVVVPCDNLNLGITIGQRHSHGLGSIEQGAEGHANDVGGNNLVLGVTERFVGSTLHSRIDIIGSDSALNHCNQQSGGAGGSGNTLSGTNELAVQLGDNQADSLGSAGGVGNDVHSGSPGSSQITLALRTVQNHLVTSIGMDGTHDTGLNRSQIIQSLSHGSQAVGGAGSSGDDVIVLGQGLMVDIVDDRRQVITRRGRNDNLLGAGVDVSLSLCLGGIEAGTFQNHIDSQLAPGQLSSVGLGINRDLFTINGNGAVTPVNIVTLGNIIALRGIVLQQVSQHLGCGQIIDGDDFITVCSEHLPECETTDTTKTIDCNFYRHKTLPSVLHFSRI
nr:MAG TPA: hypothetical protein [Bacteriophage sp.]